MHDSMTPTLQTSHLQRERARSRGSFKLGRTQQIPDLNSRAHHTVASGLHDVTFFTHTHTRGNPRQAQARRNLRFCGETHIARQHAHTRQPPSSAARRALDREAHHVVSTSCTLHYGKLRDVEEQNCTFRQKVCTII